MRTPRGSSRGWRRRRTAQQPRRGAGDRRRGIPGGGTGTRHRPATAARCRAAAAARYRPVARSRSRSRPDLPRAPIRRVVSLAQPQMRTLVSRVPMSSENLAGRTVAGYRLLERVGEGGTAEVYRAEHPERGPCAFKVLRQRLRGDPTAVKRFLREAGYGTRVRHPGVVRTYDYGEADGLYYLALEWADGKSLADYVHRAGRLAPAQVGRLVRQRAHAARAVPTAAQWGPGTAEPGSPRRPVPGGARGRCHARSGARPGETTAHRGGVRRRCRGRDCRRAGSERRWTARGAETCLGMAPLIEFSSSTYYYSHQP